MSQKSLLSTRLHRAVLLLTLIQRFDFPLAFSDVATPDFVCLGPSEGTKL